MNWKELTANIIAKGGGIVALVFGILGFLLGALFVIVGIIISLTIIFAIIGIPAIIFGFFIMVGASTMAWAGLTAISWKPKFKSTEEELEKTNKAKDQRIEEMRKRNDWYTVEEAEDDQEVHKETN